MQSYIVECLNSGDWGSIREAHERNPVQVVQHLAENIASEHILPSEELYILKLLPEHPVVLATLVSRQSEYFLRGLSAFLQNFMTLSDYVPIQSTPVQQMTKFFTLVVLAKVQWVVWWELVLAWPRNGLVSEMDARVAIGPCLQYLTPLLRSQLHPLSQEYLARLCKVAL